MVRTEEAVRPDASTPVGTAVHLDFRKYDGAEHWQERYRLLGVDAHGVWLGMPAGVSYGRPGLHLVSKAPTVRLLPHPESFAGAHDRFAACFNAPSSDDPRDISIYVDITTPPVWSVTPEGLRATLIDVDLDVVGRFNSEIFIDDEDEFAEHTVRYAYPDDLIAATRAAADAVFELVRSRIAPFDGTGESWLECL